MDYKKSVTATILRQETLCKNVFDLYLSAPEAARAAAPGQFVNLSVPDGYLRRPISICDVEGDTLRLVYEVKGPGLLSLSKQVPGQTVNLLGPLGNGFDLAAEAKNPFVVGGGIGIFPLLYLARKKKVNAVLGFRSAAQVCLVDDFRVICPSVDVATDDGSVGFFGNVCDVLRQKIKAGDQPDRIYACGPKPMLAALAALTVEFHIPTQVSLEERMACGIGACLGCAVKIRTAAGEEYRHVCKDGPVFEAESVVF